MDIATIKSILHRQLGVKKPVIALQWSKEAPGDIKAYADKNNICYMFREVLEEQRTFYTTMEDHVCLLGCAATGLDPGLQHMSAGERAQSDEFHVASVNIFPSEAIQAKAEQEADLLFPKFKEVYQAVIMGPLGSIPEPDVLILFGTPEQVHLLTRAYCYATGSFIKGYAGMGACRMLLPHAFINKEPTFTVSDRAWRKALQLAPDELTLVTPPDRLVIMLEHLEESQK